MTEREFVQKYGEHSTKNKSDALTEADRVRQQGLDVVAVSYPTLGYGVTLRRVAVALQLEIIENHA